MARLELGRGERNTQLYDEAAMQIIRAIRGTRLHGLSRRQIRRLEREPQRPLFLNANNPLPYDATVIAAVNAVTALFNSGFIKIYTGAQPALNAAVTGTLLVTLTYGATAFATATASGGVVTGTANAITAGSAGNTGTAGYMALQTSASVMIGTGSVGTSSADLNLNTLTITSGNNVSCSSFLVTMPET
jgi:hypothetical protein